MSYTQQCTFRWVKIGYPGDFPPLYIIVGLSFDYNVAASSLAQFERLGRAPQAFEKLTLLTTTTASARISRPVLRCTISSTGHNSAFLRGDSCCRFPRQFTDNLSLSDISSCFALIPSLEMLCARMLVSQICRSYCTRVAGSTRLGCGFFLQNNADEYGRRHANGAALRRSGQRRQSYCEAVERKYQSKVSCTALSVLCSLCAIRRSAAFRCVNFIYDLFSLTVNVSAALFINLCTLVAFADHGCDDGRDRACAILHERLDSFLRNITRHLDYRAGACPLRCSKAHTPKLTRRSRIRRCSCCCSPSTERVASSSSRSWRSSRSGR